MRIPFRFVITVLLMMSAMWANASAIDIDDVPVISMKYHIQALQDPESQFSIENVLTRSDEFTSVDVYPAQGYTRDTYWFRIPVSRALQVPEQWVLKLNPAYLDHVTVWVSHEGQLTPASKIGRLDDGGAGYILSDALQTQLMIPAGHSWIYFRIQTVTTLTMIPTLYQPDAFIRLNDKTTFKLGIVGGVMLIVFIFNMACWGLTRFGIYGLFSGYVGFGLLSILDGSGMLSGYFIPQWQLGSIRPLSIFLGFSWLFAFLFFRQMLVDKKRDWWIYRLYQLLYLTAIAEVIAGFAGGTAYSYVAEVIGPVGSTVTLLTLIPAFRMIFYSNKTSHKIQGLAFLPMAFYLTSNQLLTSGWVAPSLLNILGQTQGGMMQIVLLQVALLYRVRDLIGERNRAVEEAALVNEEVTRERAIREEQSRFLSMITHEIRTPLAVIDLAVQSVRVMDDKPDTFREVRYSRIQSAVKRMSTLLELGLKRDGFSSEIWEPDREVDLSSISRKAIREFPVDLQSRINFIPPTENIIVKGNSAALKLTFFNLVENALKYSRVEDGVQVSVGKTADDVFWQIDDRGEGVSQEQKGHIFERFYRAAEVSGKPGLGLGLFIAKQVIERHGGRIECLTSELGGACFRCIFPREYRS